MDKIDQLYAHLRPTASRPLLGLTVLVVEDSRFACDAMRLLCLRSGARIRRADCIASAKRHLKVYCPSAVIIDLGLPDGSGAELIAELAVAVPRVDVILGRSGDSFGEEVALAAGADGFLAKPIASVGAFQQAVLKVLPSERHPPGPRVICRDAVDPDPVAYRDDMAHAADVLNESDGSTIDYVVQFLSGVARSAGDDALHSAATMLAEKRKRREPAQHELARMAALVQDRLVQRAAI